MISIVGVVVRTRREVGGVEMETRMLDGGGVNSISRISSWGGARDVRDSIIEGVWIVSRVSKFRKWISVRAVPLCGGGSAGLFFVIFGVVSELQFL